MKKMTKETLFEFKKNKLDSLDNWEHSEIEETPNNIDNIDDIDINVDTSDMEDVEEIEFQENPFEDELISALLAEIKIPEYNRAALQFSLKNNEDEIILGVPMARLSSGAFVFKLADGSLKKFFIKDLLIEQKKNKKRKKLNEIFNEDVDNYPTSWEDNEDSEFNQNSPEYLLTDGRIVKMIEANILDSDDQYNLFYYFLDENYNQLFFRDIKKYLEDDDYDEIKAIMNYASNQNKETTYES